MQNLKENQSSRKKSTTKKNTGYLPPVKRHHLEMGIVKGVILYELPEWGLLVKAKVNNATIKIHIVRNFERRYLDISPYIKRFGYPVKGKISIWLDTNL